MKIVSRRKIQRILAAALSGMILLTGCAVKDGNAGSLEEIAGSNEEAQVNAGVGSDNTGNLGAQSASVENQDPSVMDRAMPQGTDEMQSESKSAGTDNDPTTEQEAVRPSKEEVLAMREQVLEGMSAEEIKRLTENIKVANHQMESGYLYDDIFGKLEDPEHLYWNYFDEKGDIQVGWEFDGSYQEMREIMEKENLTKDEFDSCYGTPVMVYNRFDAGNFMELMGEMQELVQDEKLKEDLQQLIDETELAAETHEMEHAANVYRILHDMDYYLLRYGLEDVGQYVQDTSTIAKYYGVLSVYE